MNECLIGNIVKNVPYLHAKIDDRLLVIQHHGDYSLIVDTGFSGAVMLPESILRKLDVQLKGSGMFELANGDRVELPIFRGEVKVMGRKIETWFIPGDYLVGMEFLASIASELVFDFKQRLLLLKK